MNISLRLFLLSIICLLFTSFTLPSSGDLTIQIENIKTSKGVIWIGIYNSADNFLIKEKSILKKINVNHIGTAKLTVPKLDFGEYAVALFHDINENGEMDNDFWGIPIEPFAFSGNLESKWRKPQYEEVKFQFWSQNRPLKLKLKAWSIF